MNAPETTCQICGRPIKSNTGLIAHHGYRRPDVGWQTASCRGAKHLPYEQSCDLIPVVIEQIKHYISRQELNLALLVTFPPEKLVDMWRGKQIIAIRPANFDSVNTRYSGIPDSYAHIFNTRVSHVQGFIKEAQHDLEYLQKRLADWKPAVVAVTE